MISDHEPKESRWELLRFHHQLSFVVTINANSANHFETMCGEVNFNIIPNNNNNNNSNNNIVRH